MIAGAFSFAVFARNTGFVSGNVCPITTGTPGFDNASFFIRYLFKAIAQHIHMIPTNIGNNRKQGVITLVLSSLPPNPTSITAMSMSSFTK